MIIRHIQKWNKVKNKEELLKKEKEFKDRYCEVNKIQDRSHRVEEEPGRVEYTMVLKR